MFPIRDTKKKKKNPAQQRARPKYLPVERSLFPLAGKGFRKWVLPFVAALLFSVYLYLNFGRGKSERKTSSAVRNGH